ncbi:MAG: hypothetical protein SFW67_03385 [Myxococcaceae bacterium]|nr:hypothetical protein [Myxococcaceae bacterium]
MAWSLLVVSLVAAAPLDMTWGTGPQGLEKLAATPDDVLLKQVLACAKGYKVKSIERRGAGVVWSASDPATDALEGVSKAERVALLSLMGRQARGAEFDLLVPQGAGAFVPVSVIWEAVDLVTFASGPAWTPPAPGDVTVKDVQARFKVGAFTEGDRPWDARALSLVAAALQSLSPEELALVSGLGFRRLSQGTQRGGRGQERLALYQRGDDTNTIELYDAAFQLDGEQFVGAPEAPRPFILTALVHELGHALADARMRELGLANLALRRAYEQKKAAGQPADAEFEKADKAVRRLLAFDAANRQGRPVERDFLVVLPQQRSPTPYGRSRPAEHFAECFSLWKNDRAALARIAPEAAAWFDEGKHVAIAGKALE